MSAKLRSPTKVHVPLVWANSDTLAPVTKGNTTSTARAAPAGITQA